MPPLLEVQDLTVQFATDDGLVHAVNGATFHVGEGQTLAVVGESGCGKSTTMLALLGLLPEAGRVVGGQARYKGRDLLNMTAEERRTVRGAQIGLVLQDALAALNPVLTIGEQVAEPLQLHLGLSRQQARRQAMDWLSRVGIPGGQARLADYPHELSGGMRQRVMIAMALAAAPSLLIADEPTTALDATVQAQVIDLVKRLRAELGLSIIWVTHDLGVVAGLADRVLVMYAGSVVEDAPTHDLYATPRHPYTLGLLGALLRLDQPARRPVPIPGRPPDLRRPPVGCAFAPRCPFVLERCWHERPVLAGPASSRPEPSLPQEGQGRAQPDHRVACWVDVPDESRLNEN